MEILNLDYNIGRIVLIALNTTPNKIEAAKCLGITKRTLFNHIRRYDITVYSESGKKGYKSDSKLMEIVCRYNDGSVRLPDVTLLHLLRWLDNVNDEYYYSIDSDGELSQTTIYKEGKDTIEGYCLLWLDLSKPLLRDQSEDVINELVKLLK